MRGSTLFKCVQGAVQVAMVWRAAAVLLVLSEEGGKWGAAGGRKVGRSRSARLRCLDKFIAATLEVVGLEGGVVRAVRRGGL